MLRVGTVVAVVDARDKYGLPSHATVQSLARAVVARAQQVQRGEAFSALVGALGEVVAEPGGEVGVDLVGLGELGGGVDAGFVGEGVGEVGDGVEFGAVAEGGG
ncbi:hypothetical protein SAMN04487818_115155 [Actinokineospora terrae]|uniref:Uncharacterized protein n=1 Tax=Actinokineospora terrae TaxID=155974 RepID=A0A1H9XHY9_9PSEU|nr:hypothetical protein SAMN04487818_115155 [Actinokineospora terrae]